MRLVLAFTAQNMEMYRQICALEAAEQNFKGTIRRKMCCSIHFARQLCHPSRGPSGKLTVLFHTHARGLSWGGVLKTRCNKHTVTGNYTGCTQLARVIARLRRTNRPLDSSFILRAPSLPKAQATLIASRVVSGTRLWRAMIAQLC